MERKLEATGIISSNLYVSRMRMNRGMRTMVRVFLFHIMMTAADRGNDLFRYAFTVHISPYRID